MVHLTAYSRVSRSQAIAAIERRWGNAPPWRAIRRSYGAEDVVRLHRQGQPDLSQARQGAERLCNMLCLGPGALPLRAILARSGGQALQGLQSGAGSLCLIDAVQIVSAAVNDTPSLLINRVTHIAMALHRAEQRQSREGIQPGEGHYVDYASPLLANATDCTGSSLDVYQAVQRLLEAGVAGVVLDDHHADRTGSLPPPTISGEAMVQDLTAARMAADVADSDTLLIARTCAVEEDNAMPSPHALEQAIGRAQIWAPYTDIVGFRSVQGDLLGAARFAANLRQHFPHKLLCYDGPGSGDPALRQQLSHLGYHFVLPNQTPVEAPPAARRPFEVNLSRDARSY